MLLLIGSCNRLHDLFYSRSLLFANLVTTLNEQLGISIHGLRIGRGASYQLSQLVDRVSARCSQIERVSSAELRTVSGQTRPLPEGWQGQLSRRQLSHGLPELKLFIFCQFCKWYVSLDIDAFNWYTMQYMFITLLKEGSAITFYRVLTYGYQVSKCLEHLGRRVNYFEFKLLQVKCIKSSNIK